MTPLQLYLLQLYISAHGFPEAKSGKVNTVVTVIASCRMSLVGIQYIGNLILSICGKECKAASIPLANTYLPTPGKQFP